AKYVNDLGLPEYDSHVLTLTKEMSDFFEGASEKGADVELTSNWLVGEVSAYLNANYKEIDEVALTPEGLGKLISLIEKGTISSKIAKKVFKDLIEKGGDPEQIVKDKGLVQISDEGELRSIVSGILDENEQSIEDYKNGKDRAIGFL
ncbi:Asp-tRNA(Asn)/Glu-tRNA(Gln) amidotransferase GatCAB subunit B, partial [Staphylococcus sp. SIMBA_130]